MKNQSLVLLLLLLSTRLIGQEVQTRAEFLQDSMLMGEPVELSITVSYPANAQLLFPDSSYQYTPFEFVDKRFYPTERNSDTLTDSVVYTLRSFEIEQTQTLRLPVYLVRNDSITFETNPVKIFLKEEINQLSDSLTYKKELSFNDTPTEFNYPFFLIGLGILIIILLAIVIFFGKKIIRSIRIWRLKRMQNKFAEEFNAAIGNVSQENAEALAFQWKKHMQKLTKIPFTAITSQETERYTSKPKLTQSLKSIDAAIYSSKHRESLKEAFYSLNAYASILFEERINSLKKNG